MLKKSSLLACVCLGFVPFWVCPTAFGQENQTAGNNSQTPRKKPFFPNWQMVAQADFIVQGKLHVPADDIRERVKIKRPDYVSLRLDVHRALKGKPTTRTLVIRIYTDDAAYSPSISTVLKSDGKEVVVSLVQVDEMSGQLFSRGTRLRRFCRPAALQPRAWATNGTTRSPSRRIMRVRALLPRRRWTAKSKSSWME